MKAVRSLLRRMTHGLTLGVRVIARDDQGRILLVRHGYTPGWHLPGGGVDLGETAEEAAHRELREETNVSAASPLVLHGLFFNPVFGGRDHVACYRASDLIIGPPPRPRLEIAEIGFFAVDAPPPGLTAGTARRIAEVCGQAPLSPTW
ncbi:MAG: DNA mismatch repair protein MutT [Rhizobiales bacterium 17-65-6]|nr:MAG: DNA mismatch repair protein MutT [Azorhizobium sp. 32-67-21]OZA01372.1 MAG: DNA mismatch repair protein MutT [Rhizobiales bacterium 17-65-6]